MADDQDGLSVIQQVTDPVERVKRYTEYIDRLAMLTASASKGRQDALTEALQKSGLTQAELAEAVGLTRTRINQMIKAGTVPPADRALLAPEAGSSLTVAIVEKRATEGDRPSILLTTKQALDKIIDFARSLGLDSEEERIGPPGLIDLNRSNLAVLIGPRISALIATVITSDPVIKWSQDRRGRWHITDSKTGAEYYSDFDEGRNLPGDSEHTCYAHIGRIRRPDGNGSFLYLGGIHAAGTAGAVDLFLREVPNIWDQAKRSQWSAVVATKAEVTGEVISAELATPIYVHGKR